MTLVAVVKRPLPSRHLRTSDIESDTVSCGVGGVPVGCWVETECLRPLDFVLVTGLTSALTWATTDGLAISAQARATWLSLLESSGELLLSDLRVEKHKIGDAAMTCEKH